MLSTPLWARAFVFGVRRRDLDGEARLGGIREVQTYPHAFGRRDVLSLHVPGRHAAFYAV